MILAPTVNINPSRSGAGTSRVRRGPLLTARMAVAYIQALQSEKVIPSVKHFAATTRSLSAPH